VLQTLTDYIGEIQKLASTCQFSQDYLQDALIMAFIFRLQDENTSHKLTEKDLMLEKAIVTAQSLQVANKGAHKMASQPSLSVQAISSLHK